MQQYISRYTYKNGCVEHRGKKDGIHLYYPEKNHHRRLFKARTGAIRHICVFKDHRHEACIDGCDIIYKNNALENCSSASAAAAEIRRANLYAYIHSAKARPFSVYAVYGYHIRV